MLRKDDRGEWEVGLFMGTPCSLIILPSPTPSLLNRVAKPDLKPDPFPA